MSAANWVKNSARRVVGERSYFRLVGLYRYILIRPKLNDGFGRPYDIVFYCEQPSHWQNIELVVRRLIEVCPILKVRLVTTYKQDDYPDVDYPADLIIDFHIPASVLRFLNTRILYTPRVGLDSGMRPRRAAVVHTLVSLTGLDGVYTSQMFDSYDYILCAGPHQMFDFRRWSVTNAQLRQKTLIPAGYPKLDLMVAQVQSLAPPTTDTFTVVYAPTHVYSVNEKLASLREHGEAIVDALLAADLRVVFRPHPVSFRDADSRIVEKIIEKNSAHGNFVVDRSKNYLASYAQANLMVTDLSGTGFTFSFSFLRPSVFFAANEEAEQGLHGIQFEDREKIGGLVRSVAELIQAIDRARSGGISEEEILAYRGRALFNVGCSAEYIVGALSAVLEGRAGSDWVRL